MQPFGTHHITLDVQEDVQISTGFGYYYLWNKKGDIHCEGDNPYGQLVRSEGREFWERVSVREGDWIGKVDCGFAHVLFLTGFFYGCCEGLDWEGIDGFVV
eukprot:TRINITY_DN9754_c0_g1_i1.p1 TRINITY_DN9754_c0_g1~~TRINITY_DN9754_c0_g1_i1.p1  ORF type:complete len:101 (+),score=27.72 TRINITY_DN9754_c0_g1_i1:79-381(+)